MPNPIVEVPRAELGGLLDRITVNPEYIFSVVCRRRGDLFQKYPPVNDLARGKDCHVGDHSDMATRQFVQGSRRVADKIVLQPAGTLRKMIVKRKVTDAPTKHWQPKGGRLAFDPAERGLRLVAGMYNDATKDVGLGKMIGRHGDWRPWAFICLRTTTELTYAGTDYRVTD